MNPASTVITVATLWTQLDADAPPPGVASERDIVLQRQFSHHGKTMRPTSAVLNVTSGLGEEARWNLAVSGPLLRKDGKPGETYTSAEYASKGGWSPDGEPPAWLRELIDPQIEAALQLFARPAHAERIIAALQDVASRRGSVDGSSEAAWEEAIEVARSTP